MIEISIQNITRRFGETVAIDDVSLDLAPGSFTALLGPSGCGKSTLLRLIAGFEKPDAGRLMFDGKPVADAVRQVAPEQRNVGIVFQSYALWPHMDVAGNVAYPLRARGVAKTAIGPRVDEALATVGLRGFSARAVDELSGGQRQRVALARCLIAGTPVILFDEPLANLDMHLRASMIETFREVAARTGATIVYVTHDQAEALALADRIAVLDQGRVQQFASPADVYDSPANAMVAGFVGRGTILTADVMQADGGTVALIGGTRIAVRGVAQGATGRILLRPESLSLAKDGMKATVVSSTFRGPVHEVRAKLADSDQIVVFDARRAPKVGDAVRLAVDDAWIVPG